MLGRSHHGAQQGRVKGGSGDREMRGDEDHKNNGEDEPELLFGCEKVKKMIFSAYELITS